MEHFINNGYGWVCVRCTASESSRADEGDARGRFFREGEAEDKEPTLSTPALARWRDRKRGILVCPRCGTEEINGENK
jgi:ribosomal protein L40E